MVRRFVLPSLVIAFGVLGLWLALRSSPSRPVRPPVLDEPNPPARDAAPAVVPGPPPAAPSVVPASVAPPRMGGRTIVGTVTDGDLASISGATVRWIGRAGDATVERETLTLSDGSYRLDGLPPAREGAASGWIECRAEGFAPIVAAEWVSATSEGDESRSDVVLLRGSSVEGRVVDAETGEPLAGAHVVSWLVEPSWKHESIDIARSPFRLDDVVAAPDGSFELSRLPAKGFNRVAEEPGPGGHVVGYVSAIVPGYTARSAGIPVAHDGARATVTIRCWPSGTVRGRVVDDAGRPLAGAEVWSCATDDAFEMDDRIPEFAGDAPRTWGRTDEEGRYEIAGVRAGRRAPRRVALSARTTLETWKGGIRSPRIFDLEKLPGVDVTAGDATNAPDIVIAREPSVVVEVVDDAGAPVADAVVSFDAVEPRRRSTAADGRATLPFSLACAGKAVRVAVRKPGYAGALTPTFTPDVASPPIVRVALARGRKLAGHVKRADGSAAPGVDVRAAVVGSDIGRRSDVIPSFVQLVDPRGGGSRTQGDGTFEIADLADGPFVVTARPRTGPLSGRQPVTLDRVPADTLDLELTLPPQDLPPSRATLDVTVVDAATEKPVASAVVYTRCGNESGISPRRSPGQVRFDDVALGDWTISAEAEGWITSSATASVRSIGETVPVVVALRRAARVHGVVRGLPARNRTGATVSLSDQSISHQVKAVLGPRDSFEIADVWPGRYSVRVDLRHAFDEPGGLFGPISSTPFVVPEGAGDLELDLDVVPIGPLQIWISGNRLPQASAKTSSDAELALGRDSHLSIVDASGRVCWETREVQASHTYRQDLPVGRYVVRLEVPGDDVREQSADVDGTLGPEVRFEVP
jgi:hypothetical protein